LFTFFCWLIILLYILIQNNAVGERCHFLFTPAPKGPFIKNLNVTGSLVVCTCLLQLQLFVAVDVIMIFLFRWFDAILQALGLKNKQARILIVGLDNAGKSTLVHKLCTNEVRSFVPTIKAHSKTFTLGRIEFTAWDLGGHEQVISSFLLFFDRFLSCYFMQVRDLWEEFYSNADAVVFMVDSADKQRFDEAKGELYQILESDELKSVPILILGNKNDLEVCMPVVMPLPFVGLNCFKLPMTAQGSESRDTIKDRLGLTKYMDGDTDDVDDERVLEVRPPPLVPCQQFSAKSRRRQVFMCSLVSSSGYTEGFQWLSQHL
jgi:GTP-binding protein SAR1